MYLISHKEIVGIDVAYSLAAGAMSILFQQHGTAIVLIEYAVINLVPLSLKKVLGPEDLAHTIIPGRKVGFSQASCVQFLLHRSSIYNALS